MLQPHEQIKDRKLGMGSPGHSFLVHTGCALPMTDD